jgi:Domain of unknown function (DUF1851)
MQHLTISLDGIDGARLLHDWQWLLCGSHRLLAITRMGDAFVEKADGEVIFLDTLEGALKHAAPNQNAFFKLLKAGALDPTWFIPDMVALLEARSDHLASGQCYSYKIPPVLGGSLESAKRQGRQRHGALQRHGPTSRADQTSPARHQGQSLQNR